MSGESTVLNFKNKDTKLLKQIIEIMLATGFGSNLATKVTLQHPGNEEAAVEELFSIVEESEEDAQSSGAVDTSSYVEDLIEETQTEKEQALSDLACAMLDIHQRCSDYYLEFLDPKCSSFTVTITVKLFDEELVFDCDAYNSIEVASYFLAALDRIDTKLNWPISNND